MIKGIKVAMVSPIDKKTDGKNVFQLQACKCAFIFSNVYEIELKNALVSALSEYMSPCFGLQKGIWHSTCSVKIN